MNRYVVLDIETTGTHPTRNEIIEIGAVYIENGKPIKKFNQLVCPRESISDYITSITGIDDEIVKDADFVFTGEGKIDSQSLGGKVVIGVSKRAKLHGIPVIAVVGGAEGDMSGAYEKGVKAIFTINRLPQVFSVRLYKSEENLEFALDNILRVL